MLVVSTIPFSISASAKKFSGNAFLCLTLKDHEELYLALANKDEKGWRYKISDGGANGCIFAENTNFEYSVIDTGWSGWSQIRVYLSESETQEFFIESGKLK